MRDRNAGKCRNIDGIPCYVINNDPDDAMGRKLQRQEYALSYNLLVMFRLCAEVDSTSKVGGGKSDPCRPPN